AAGDRRRTAAHQRRQGSQGRVAAEGQGTRGGGGLGMSGRLQGRKIVLTGAAAGIGRATAELFAAEGAELALLDRDAAALAGLQGHAIEVDVADEPSVARAIEEAASKLGGIDGLVNIAG